MFTNSTLDISTRFLLFLLPVMFIVTWLTATCFPKSITISSTPFLVDLLALLKSTIKSSPFSPAFGIFILPADGAFADGAFITICSVLLTLLVVLSKLIGIDTGLVSDISTSVPSSAILVCNTTELFSLFNMFLISPWTSTLLIYISIELHQYQL